MAEVDVAEEVPNSDDSAFTNGQEQQQEEEQSHVTVQPTVHNVVPVSQVAPQNIYVATSQGLVSASAEQLQEAGIKTTHIVIHDQGLEELKTPTTPIPPPTPATPLSKEKGFKYQWDESVFESVLPVRCKNSNGELHKNRFGSGEISCETYDQVTHT